MFPGANPLFSDLFNTSFLAGGFFPALAGRRPQDSFTPSSGGPTGIVSPSVSFHDQLRHEPVPPFTRRSSLTEGAW